MNGAAAWSEHRLISFDETPLFYRRLRAPRASSGTLCFVHGMGEHGGRYRHVAEYFRELGYDALVPDLRGFGRSGGRRGCGTFTAFFKDLSAFHHLVFKQDRDKPFYLLGHSFGGLLAATYAAEFPRPRLDGLMLSSPLMGLSVRIPLWRHLLGLSLSRVAPHVTQRNRIDPARLSRDGALVQEYRSDPLVHPWISAGLYAQIASAIRRRRRIARRLAVPVCIVQAGEDHLISKQDVSDFYDSVLTEDKEMTVFDGYYHEVLNEIGREKVFHSLSAWMMKHADRLRGLA